MNETAKSSRQGLLSTWTVILSNYKENETPTEKRIAMKVTLTPQGLENADGTDYAKRLAGYSATIESEKGAYTDVEYRVEVMHESDDILTKIYYAATYDQAESLAYAVMAEKVEN